MPNDDKVTAADLDTVSCVSNVAHRLADKILKVYPPRYSSRFSLDYFDGDQLVFSDHHGDTHYVNAEVILELQDLTDDEIDALAWERDVARHEAEMHKAASREAQRAALVEAQEREQLRRLLDKYGDGAPAA